MNSELAYDLEMPRGRPRKGKDARKPSDYPSYAFRVPEGDSEAVERLIGRVKSLMEKQKPLGEAPITTGRVLARAVVVGLETLAEELSKK